MISVPTMRFVHHLIIWLVWGFMIHHVYSAILVNRVEGSGLITSIFSGYKFLPTSGSSIGRIDGSVRTDCPR